MNFFKSDNFHSFIWFQRILTYAKLVNFVAVRWKKVPFYSLFCWIKRRQFFKALKIKAYLWHISCFVLPKLCDGQKRAPQNAFSLNAALLCVAVPYTLRQKHYQIWCNDPILLSDKWLVCWAIFLPFCFISNGKLLSQFKLKHSLFLDTH